MARPQVRPRPAADRAIAGGGSVPAEVGSDDARAILGRALQDQYQVLRGDTTTEVLNHLDTADWRLRRAGIDLVFDPKARRLRVYRKQDAPVDQSTGAIDWPALVSLIPDGAVRDLISGPAWIRALLPFATSEAENIRFDVLNDDGKTVTRVRWRQGSLRDPVRHPLPVDASVDRLRGYTGEATTVERLLGASVPISVAGTRWLGAVRALTSPNTPAGQRFGMHPDHAADLAVADALLGYLDKLETNVEGILADTDTEYLHQFRVEARRSRSILKLLGDVLPAGMAERAADELRWLGTATTPTRDLDVYLLEIDELTSLVRRPGDLTSLGVHIQKCRTAERAALLPVLRSPRFASFLVQWRTDLAGVIATHSRSRATVSQLADERIRRTFGKVGKRANAVTSTSPGEQIHALRKACKEMRYLLELFRPVCDPKAYKTVVADFKDLQDVLGEFQDGEVQAAALSVFARQMLHEGHVDADTILAMGALSAHFETRQCVARAALSQRPGCHLGGRVSTHVRRLVTA